MSKGLLFGLLVAMGILFTVDSFAQPQQNRIEVDNSTGDAVSIDHRHTLHWEDSHLWLVDLQTMQRKLLATRNSALAAGWSPDGRFFYVEDRVASSEQHLSIYTDSGALFLAVDEAILHADMQARELFHNSHAYFAAIDWLNREELQVRYFGHTDYYPSRCFDLKFRLSLWENADDPLRSFSVHRTKLLIAPAGSSVCRQL